MARKEYDWFSRQYRIKHTVGVVHKVGNRVLENYRGTKGYVVRWGRYVGIVGTMLEYLRYQRPDRFNFYDLLLTTRNKRGAEKLSVDELNELMLDIWKLLDYDTQRKFEHYIWVLDRNFKENYNV